MVERTLPRCRLSPFRGIRMRRLRLVSIAIPAILVALFSITPASASGAGVGIVPQGTQSDAAYAQSGTANHVKNVFATSQRTSCYRPEVPYAANLGPTAGDGYSGETPCGN